MLEGQQLRMCFVAEVYMGHDMFDMLHLEVGP